MRTPSAFITALALGLACTERAPAPRPPRVALERTGGASFRLIPAEGQLPHCLAYTVSRAGLTRQLTMSPRNEAFECPGGAAVGGGSFRVPAAEGPVKVHVVFTSQPVSAATVTEQLLEAGDRQRLDAMNLRLPGRAAVETLDFQPTADKTQAP